MNTTKKTAWALGGKIFNTSCGLGINALLARLLAPEDLGRYFLALSIVSFLSLAGSAGLGRGIVRFIAECLYGGQEDKLIPVIKKALRICFSVSLSIGLLFIFFGESICNWFFPDFLVDGAGVWIGLWVIVLGLNHLLPEIFRGLDDIPSAVFFKNTLTSLFSLSVLVVFYLAAINLGFTRVIIVLVFTAGVTCSVGMWWLNRRLAQQAHGPVCNKDRADSGFFRIIAPLFIADLAIFSIGQADLWILGGVGGVESLALYGASARLSMLVIIPLMLMNAIVPPMIARKNVEEKRIELQRDLRVAATYASGLAVATYLPMLLWGSQLMGFVFGPHYTGGGLILGLLGFANLFTVATGSCTLLLMLTGRQTLIMWISLVNGGLLFVVGGLVASRFGALGMAWAMVSIAVVQNLVTLLIAHRSTGIWTHITLRKATLK